MESFGEIIKYVRTSKNMSFVKLSKLSGISVRQIQRIETSDIVEGKLYTLESLSNALGVNLVEYALVFSEFTNLKEFQQYSYLRYLIEDMNIPEIKNFISNYEQTHLIKENLTSYTQLLLYAKAIQIVESTKNYKLGLKYCFKALNVNESQFNTNKIFKYARNDICYAIISQIESYSFYLQNYELSLSISTELIGIIENRFYNTELPLTSVPYIVFRIYIISLNNKADNLFCNEKFKESLNLCLKATDVLHKSRSLFGLNYLYWLISENYYKIKDFDNSKIYLKKALSICISEDKLDYANKIKTKVLSKYPLLNNEPILSIL